MAHITLNKHGGYSNDLFQQLNYQPLTPYAETGCVFYLQSKQCRLK